MSLSGGTKRRKRRRVAAPHTPVTSPLVGEVGVAKRRREGGVLYRPGQEFTRLPDPPPQGGRERTEQAAIKASGSDQKRSKPDPQALLDWYGRHRRKLPWRAYPGERPDPYRVGLSEIMLQQTRVSAVLPYYARFLARWPNVRALAAAPLEEVLKVWAGLGYYVRARNLHACARAVVERHGGVFPREENALRSLPGIG